MYVGRQLLAGMVAPWHEQLVWRCWPKSATTGQVGDEPAGSGMVARDHVAPETPWQPPRSLHVVVDAASAELQGRPWHGRNDVPVVEIQDQPQLRGATIDKQEARPGRSCCSRVLMHKRHHQRAEAVVSNVSTKVTELAKRSKAAWHGSPNMGSRSEVIVDEHSQVSNSVDRTNKCAHNRERKTGKLSQLMHGRAPHHLCLVGIELEAIRTHPAGDVFEPPWGVERQRTMFILGSLESAS